MFSYLVLSNIFQQFVNTDIFVSVHDFAELEVLATKWLNLSAWSQHPLLQRLVNF